MTLLSSYPPHPHAPHACTPPRRTHTHTHTQGQALAHSQGTRARARAGTHTCAHSHTHAHQRPHCTPARTRAHKDGASSAAAPGARRVHGPLARRGIRHHLSTLAHARPPTPTLHASTHARTQRRSELRRRARGAVGARPPCKARHPAPSFSEAPSLGVSLPHLRWVWCFLCSTSVGCSACVVAFCFLVSFPLSGFAFPNGVNKAAGRYFIAFLLSGLQSTLTR